MAAPTLEESSTPSPAPGSLAHLGDERQMGRMVLRIAWPAILENSLHTLLGIVDTILVARLGTDAIAGVGAGVQWIFLFFSVLFGLSTGAVVLVARAIGGGDPEAAARAARQAVLFGGALGLAYSLGAVLLAEPAIQVLGGDPEVVRIGASFLRITAFGGVAMSLTIMCGAVLRAAGDTRTPMYVTAISNVVNAGVAYVLIFGALGLPALGTDGSAWGLVAARVVSAVLLLAILVRGVRSLTLAAGRTWAPDFGILRSITRIGGPTALEQILLMGSFMAYARIAMELGTIAFATQRITFNAVTISFLPAFGFSIAATTLTGQALGAKRPDLAERASWIAVRLAAAWMGAMGLVYLFLAEPMLRVFTDEPSVIAVGVPSLMIIAAACPIWSLGMVLSGSLRGAGDTRFPLLVTLVAGWLVRVPLGFAVGIGLGYGLPGVYAGALADAVVSGVLVVWRFRRGDWRRVRV